MNARPGIKTSILLLAFFLAVKGYAQVDTAQYRSFSIAVSYTSEVKLLLPQSLNITLHGQLQKRAFYAGCNLYRFNYGVTHIIPGVEIGCGRIYQLGKKSRWSVAASFSMQYYNFVPGPVIGYRTSQKIALPFPTESYSKPVDVITINPFAELRFPELSRLTCSIYAGCGLCCHTMGAMLYPYLGARTSIRFVSF